MKLKGLLDYDHIFSDSQECILLVVDFRMLNAITTLWDSVAWFNTRWKFRDGIIDDAKKQNIEGFYQFGMERLGDYVSLQEILTKWDETNTILSQLATGQSSIWEDGGSGQTLLEGIIQTINDISAVTAIIQTRDAIASLESMLNSQLPQVMNDTEAQIASLNLNVSGALASLDLTTGSIATEVGDIGDTIDALAVQLVTDIQDITAQLLILGDRISPDGNSIVNYFLTSLDTNLAHLAALDDLTNLSFMEAIKDCICELEFKFPSQIGGGSVIGPITTVLVDEVKCNMAKRVVGKWHYQMTLIVDVFGQADIATMTAVLAATLLTGPFGIVFGPYLSLLNLIVKYLEVYGVDVEIGETTYSLRPKSEYEDLKSSFESIADDLIQSIYDNTDSDTAYADLVSIVDATAFETWQKDAIKQHFDLERIEAGYAGLIDDDYDYGHDHSQFSTYTCSGLVPTCIGQSNTVWGTPEVFLFGDPIPQNGNYNMQTPDTITQYFEVVFEYETEITINSQTGMTGGVPMQWTIKDCDGNTITTGQFYQEDLPETFTNVSRFEMNHPFNNPVSFNVTFTPGQ